MARARSLRSSLIAGLLVLQVVVLGGLSWAMYARASRIAHEALRHDAEVRARTLAGVLELDRDGHEFDLDASAVREYSNVGRPVFAIIVDADGTDVVRSPSLGDAAFAPTAPWTEDGTAYEELRPGPFGIPCVAVTHAFLVRVDKGGTKPKPGREPWVPPSEEERRYRIRVGVDARERDAALGSLQWFLVAINGAGLVATLLGGFLLARVVLRPVRRMTEDAGLLDADDPGQRLEPSTVVAELRTLAETLNGAFDRLRGALDRQRRFAADAGHELRTPVSILRSNTELLLRRPRDGAEYVEGLEMQRRTIERMQVLVEDLLTLARADAGGRVLHVDAHDVTALFSEVAAELQPVAAGRGIALDAQRGEEVVARCDPEALRRVLRNLVSNALKFTPEGGRVRVRATADPQRVRIVVEDSGPGVAEELRERIFERFFRVAEGRDRNEGTGLGLAIVRTLVEAQGGTVHVEDAEEGGARFVVALRHGEAGGGAPPRAVRSRLPAGAA